MVVYYTHGLHYMENQMNIIVSKDKIQYAVMLRWLEDMKVQYNEYWTRVPFTYRDEFFDDLGVSVSFPSNSRLVVHLGGR